MQSPTLRAGKAKDVSVRTGSKSVQKLEKNAQHITGTVADLQRRLQGLETGKVLSNSDWVHRSSAYLHSHKKPA